MIAGPALYRNAMSGLPKPRVMSYCYTSERKEANLSKKDRISPCLELDPDRQGGGASVAWVRMFRPFNLMEDDRPSAIPPLHGSDNARTCEGETKAARRWKFWFVSLQSPDSVSATLSPFSIVPSPMTIIIIIISSLVGHLP